MIFTLNFLNKSIENENSFAVQHNNKWKVEINEREDNNLKRKNQQKTELPTNNADTTYKN